jgi:beta-mannosidase
MTVSNKNHLSLLGPVWTLEDAGLARRASDKTKDYELAKPEGKLHESCPFVVPGDNYSALLKAKAIPDPYYSTNEALVQWVRDHDWKIKRKFTVTAEQLKKSEAWLVVDQLDTVADIFINGKLVGQGNNQHDICRLSCKLALWEGENEVEILFHSAVYEASKRAAKLPYPIPWSGDSNNQVPFMNLIRKTQCHSGWDWGITLVVCGIYGDVCGIDFVDDRRLDYVYTKQVWNDSQVSVAVHADTLGKGAVAGTCTFNGETKQVSVDQNQQQLAIFTIKDPKRWFPNGQGDQTLYELTVTVGETTVTKKIGLRDVKWINERDDDNGISMRINVNGRDVFCKGSNWIPADAMPGHAEEHWANLLDSLVEANQNMIRIWGGGEYSRDKFYEMCDERGIMVWHDAMYSCSLYPADEDFLKQVTSEVIHQCKRLRDHASIVLWCGDNELLGSLNWFPESKANRDRYLVNWFKLNTAVEAGIRQGDPTRQFWPSSPCSGPGDFSDNWHNDKMGDMHYWEVWHSGKGFESYYSIVPRFCSEFGYQSFSSFPLVKTFVPEDHFNATSPSMDHHQKNQGGNSKIIEMFTREFRMPSNFHAMLWLSQMQQALIIKSAIEYWRSKMPICSGTLYWQANDNWPVASWSSLEFGGGWKQLHHMAKRFYEPVVIAGFMRPVKKGEVAQVEIWCVNDSPVDFQGMANVRLTGLDGHVVTGVFGSYQVSVPAGTTKMVVCEKADKLGNLNSQFIRMDLEGASANVLNLVKWKRMDLKDPGLVSEDAEGGLKVTATTAPAFWVTIERNDSTQGHFSDNAFCLDKGESKILKWIGKGGVFTGNDVWMGDLFSSYT